MVVVLKSWSTVEVFPETKTKEREDSYFWTHCKISGWIDWSSRTTCFTRHPKVWYSASGTVMYLSSSSRPSNCLTPKVSCSKNTFKSLGPKARLIIFWLDIVSPRIIPRGWREFWTGWKRQLFCKMWIYHKSCEQKQLRGNPFLTDKTVIRAEKLLSKAFWSQKNSWFWCAKSLLKAF